MVISIKDIVKEYGIDGDIILYRDTDHKKKGLCEYIAANMQIPKDKEIVTYSDGAFGLYLARAFPDHRVHTFSYNLSHDYGELVRKQPNLIVHDKFLYSYNWHTIFPDAVEINQYFTGGDWKNICTQYYAEHFKEVVQSVNGYKIDAFCDCGHSCNTLVGFYNSKLVDWVFIRGVMVDAPDISKYPAHFKFFSNITCLEFDTVDIGNLIESRYTGFGNVYEATRSISAAMSWLKDNPGKTVLVYVGDAPIKEGSQFRDGTLSAAIARVYYLRHKFNVNLAHGKLLDYNDLAIYKKAFEDYEHKEFTYVWFLMKLVLPDTKIIDNGILQDFIQNISLLCPELDKDDLRLFYDYYQKSLFSKGEQDVMKLAEVYFQRKHNNALMDYLFGLLYFGYKYQWQHNDELNILMCEAQRPIL